MSCKKVIYLGPIEDSKKVKNLINKLDCNFVEGDILVNPIYGAKNGVEIRLLDDDQEIDSEIPFDIEIYRENKGNVLLEFGYKKGFYRILKKTKDLNEIAKILDIE